MLFQIKFFNFSICHLKQEWESVRRLTLLQSRSASTALRLIFHFRFVSEAVCIVREKYLVALFFATIKPLGRVRFFAGRFNICLYVCKGHIHTEINIILHLECT